MATDIVSEKLVLDREPPSVAGLVQERTSQPVMWWAILGGLFFALEVYVIGSWLLSGDLVRTPNGVDSVPDFFWWSVHIQEVQSTVCMLLFFYFLLWRPWRAGKGLTTDGMFVITFFFIYWQDPILNYTQQWATYNTEMFNVGSWVEQVPGWNSPNGSNFAEPLFWSGPAYVWAVFGATILSCWVMRKAKARWPRMGTAGVIFGTFGFFLVFDFLAEALWIRTGVYVYGGSIGPTFFRGHYYQFPVFELFTFAATWAAWGCLRYFKNDKGQTFAERGVDKLKVSNGKKTVLRLFAIAGVCNLIFLMGTNVPYMILGVHAHSWTKDVTERSYFMNGLCGKGTTYHCSDPNIPIPREHSKHVNPAGQLVDP